MNQSEKSILFAQMRRKGQPLLLYNIWDAGSALAWSRLRKRQLQQPLKPAVGQLLPPTALKTGS